VLFYKFRKEGCEDIIIWNPPVASLFQEGTNGGMFYQHHGTGLPDLYSTLSQGKHLKCLP